MCSSLAGERTLAWEGESVAKAAMVMVRREEEFVAEAVGTMIRQSSVAARRNMLARWDDDLLGYVKIDYLPSFHWA